MRSRDEIKAFLKRMNRFDGSMVQKACEFATFAHEGQLDKSGQEYVQHPTRVANALDKQYNDAIITTIAFMHDVIEEGNMTTSDLMLYFPEVVWKCVDILTRRNSLGRDDYIKKIGAPRCRPPTVSPRRSMPAACSSPSWASRRRLAATR